MKTPKVKRPNLIHAMSLCYDCDFEAEFFLTANKEARKHWLETGHKISVETGYDTTYPRFKK